MSGRPKSMAKPMLVAVHFIKFAYLRFANQFSAQLIAAVTLQSLWLGWQLFECNARSDSGFQKASYGSKWPVPD